MDLYRILALIAVITLVIYVVFNIVYLIDLRRTSIALRRFINRTDENLTPALVELRLTLQDLRKVTDRCFRPDGTDAVRRRSALHRREDRREPLQLLP